MGLTVLYIQNLIRQIMGLQVRFLRMGWRRKFSELYFLMEIETNREGAKMDLSHISFLISSCFSSSFPSCSDVKIARTKTEFV